MFKLIIINVILIVALCLSHLHFISADVKVYKESFNHPNRRVIFTPYYYKGETLVYALCDKNFQAYENHCQVIRKDRFLQNETLSCNIALKPEQTEGWLGPKYEVLPFAENKAILISAEIGEDTFVKLNTIHLNTCTVSVTKFHVDFPYEEALVFVVPSSDSFKVIFENTAQCGDKMCMMSIDSDGQKIVELSSVSKSMKTRSSPMIAALGTSVKDKDLFFIKFEAKNKKNFMLQKADGLKKSMARYTFKPRTTVLSTANDLIGVCYDMLTAKSNIVCTQHDSNGQLKFEFTSADKYEQLKLLSMHNLPNGGILLVVEYTDGILVIKIDPQGNMIGSFTVDDFDCSKAFMMAATFFELQDGKGHCVSMACREGNDFYIVDQSHLNFVTNCFTDADFTI